MRVEYPGSESAMKKCLQNKICNEKVLAVWRNTMKKCLHYYLKRVLGGFFPNKVGNRGVYPDCVTCSVQGRRVCKGRIKAKGKNCMESLV